MNQNTNKLLKQIIFLVITMFALIFVTVFLTGGRETYEFTKIDNIIFTVFLILELITCLVLVYVLAKYCKECVKGKPELPKVQRTKSEKIMQRRGYLLLVVAYLFALGTVILGIIIAPNIPRISVDMTRQLLGVFMFVSLIFIPLNFFLQKRFVKKIENTQVREIQQYIYSHRESAIEMKISKGRFLRWLRFASMLYYIFLAFIAFGIAFFSGVTYNGNFEMMMCLYAATLITCVLSRVRLPIPEAIFQDDKRYVSEKEFPILYELTQKAANTMQCKGRFKIAIVEGFNAGIACYGKTYSVQLGALLINVLSQDELYCVLLHEFSHVDVKNCSLNRERDYHNWLQNGMTPHFLSGFTRLLSLYLDTLYVFNYSLYEYSSALLCETDADQAAAKYGNPNMVASALLKIQYYNLYLWEKGTYDEPVFFASETMQKNFLTVELQDFLHRLELRKEDWKYFTKLEILSRRATHPTLNMRLKEIGVDTYEIYESCDEKDYKNECEKAMSFLEDLIYAEVSEQYESLRREKYIAPLHVVQGWEEEGKPIVAESYRDIGFALRQLGRNTEALEVYKQALSQLTLSSEICHARYMIGCYLLHQFEHAGIEDVYYAIENNKNYIDEGLDVIGEFCCLSGNQKELERFREKAIELGQIEKDVYCEIGILRAKDNLSTEHLPDDMLERILTYVQKIDQQSVEAIYLVRKTITDDFFTSVFIIRFVPDTSEKIKENVLHHIFSFLDTFSSWQFSLFEYSEVENVRFDKIENSCVYEIDK